MKIPALALCSGRAIAVYLVHAENPSADLQEIADGLGVSLRTVQRAVVELEAKGILVRVSQKTDYNAFMPSTLIAGDRDRSVTPWSEDRDKSVTPCEERASDVVEMSDLDRDRFVAGVVRYAVDSKQGSRAVGVLRTPTPPSAERSEGDPMGYEFFTSTPDEDTLPARRKRQPGAEKTTTAVAVPKDWRDESTWTTKDLAAFFKAEAHRRYPMKASSVGDLDEMRKILSKRQRDYGETLSAQIAMVRKFLADPQNVALAGRGTKMQKLLWAFMNRNGEKIARDAEASAYWAEKEAALETGAEPEAPATSKSEQAWDDLYALLAEG